MLMTLNINSISIEPQCVLHMLWGLQYLRSCTPWGLQYLRCTHTPTVMYMPRGHSSAALCRAKCVCDQGLVHAMHDVRGAHVALTAPLNGCAALGPVAYVLSL